MAKLENIGVKNVTQEPIFKWGGRVFNVHEAPLMMRFFSLVIFDYISSTIFWWKRAQK